MPHPFDARSLKRVCASIIHTLVAEGHKVGPALAHELAVAVFGFWTYHLCRQYGTPFTLRQGRSHAPLADHQHLRLVTQRIERLLGVDTWTAQRLAPLILSAVHASGLSVDALRTIYSADGRCDRSNIVKSLVDPDFRPTRASQGIGKGILPWPTCRTLKARIDLFAPQAVQYVGAGDTYLWESPSDELSQTHAALADTLHFSPSGTVSAALGLNYVLVKPERWKRDGTTTYVFLSPSIRFHSAGDAKDWTIAWHRPTTLHHELHVQRGHTPLEALIGEPITSLPRLQACPHCLEVFSKDLGELTHSCTAGVDAVALAALLRRLRAQAVKSARLHELRSALTQNGAGPDGDALEAFLHRHRHTLGLRLHDGTWLFVGNGVEKYPPDPTTRKS